MRPAPPGQREPHVGELFTDRSSESTAFKDSLAAFRRRLDQDGDVGAARHNVLTFYGMGGIGKSALSGRLEAWANGRLPVDTGWGFAPPTKVAATARIDLHASEGRVDVSSTLLELRAGVAPIGRRWPLFDLAFAAYWSATRPGEPLPELDGGGRLVQPLWETLTDAVGDLGSLAELTGLATGAGLGVRGVRRVVDVLRQRRVLHRAIGAYDGFEAFLLRCAEEPSPTEPRSDLACEIAGTLAWELAAMPRCPLVVVFVDTTERFALDPRRVSEGHLNELVHRMPNVLFVLTGRDRTLWYDGSRTLLPRRGRHVWPGLVPGAQGEPRQHLVGGLSSDDTRRLVRRARTELHLPMDDEVVERLVTSSAGLPQYLELARQVAVSIRDAGEGGRVGMDDVAGSLDTLALRVLEDVPGDEQRAVRAACLFRTFDVDLVAAAADVDHGCAERAVERPMIDHHGSSGATYRMHDAVREAIRRADHRRAGGWSERDWEEASTRAARAVRTRHDAAKRRDDHHGVLDAIGLAVTLACGQRTRLDPPASTGIYQDWLTRAIVFAPSVEALGSRIPGTSRTPYGQHLIDFVAASSSTLSATEREDLLRGVLDAEGPMRVPAGRHLGYLLRWQHRWDDAIAVVREVAGLSPLTVNLVQLPVTLCLARRFAEAHEVARDEPTVAYVTLSVDYAHGRPERYLASAGDRVDRLGAQGRQREHLEERGTLLVRRTLLRGDVGADVVERFADEAEASGYETAGRAALLATALRPDAGPAEADEALQRLRALDPGASGAGTVGYRYALAECCDAIAVADRDRLGVLRDQVARTPARSASWIPVECFLESVGLPVPAAEPTRWLQPYEDVLARWTSLLDAHLGRRRSARGG